MDITLCKQKLNNTLQSTPALSGNLSQLTTKAWGSEKSSCYSQFGSLQAIEKEVQNIISSQQDITVS